MFNILNLETKQLLKDRNGSLVVFEKGDRAKEFCKQSSFRLQPRKIVAAQPQQDWREREKARFADGTYKLPDYLKVLDKPDHFLHVALDDPKSLAYTKDEEKGAADVQTRTTLRGYLEKYHPTMPRDVCEKLHTKFLGKVDDGVRFAKTPDEIEQIYIKSARYASSCMSGDSWTRAGYPHHPTRAYGAGDLAIAYILNAQGNPVSRCLCWPAKRVYGRVYGSDAIHAALKARGFAKSYTYYSRVDRDSVKNNGINGARLLAIRNPDDPSLFLLPSIDENVKYKLNRAKTHFIITDKGKGQHGGGWVRYGWICYKTKRWMQPDAKQFEVTIDKYHCANIWSYPAVLKYAVRDDKGRLYADKEIRDYYTRHR